MKSHYRGHKMSIWLNLIPQLHQPGSDDVSMRHHHFHERAERFYQGIVQSETQTRLPPPYLPQNVSSQTTALPECAPNATDEANAFMEGETAAEAGILQQIIDDGHRGYAAALSATVGVGCLLLVLNLFIFAGIYYQRIKNRRLGTRSCWTRNVPETSAEIPRFPEAVEGDHAIKLLEPPPCYTSIIRSPTVRDSVPLPQRSEKFWPALKQDADGFVFVYNQHTTDQKEILMKMYSYFVQDPNVLGDNCIVLFTSLAGKDDSIGNIRSAAKSATSKTQEKVNHVVMMTNKEIHLNLKNLRKRENLNRRGSEYSGIMEATFAPLEGVEEKTPLYERLLTDIWVGILLTMLFLSCICCMCSCLIYHKFQQWKCSVLGNNEEPEIIPDLTYELDCESPPSYTAASGLPSYEEALRQMVVGM